MTYTVFLRNNKTEEVKEIPQDGEWEEGSEFWWTEGNMGCDCNRSILFGDATLENAECGDTRYTLVKVRFEGGSWHPR